MDNPSDVVGGSTIIRTIVEESIPFNNDHVLHKEVNYQLDSYQEKRFKLHDTTSVAEKS